MNTLNKYNLRLKKKNPKKQKALKRTRMARTMQDIEMPNYS
jgi:hypothetical protein